jgi:hypothetical protein
MSAGQGITQELSFGQVVSKTLELFRRDYVKYLIPFLVMEAIVGVSTTLLQRAITVPALPASATPQQVLSWAPGFFGAVVSLVAAVGIIVLIFYPIVIGTAVKLASEEIETGRADLGASIRFAATKLVSLWVVGILVGIIIVLGLIALVVPGIILGIMFSLVVPVIVIESPGVLESMGRSRKLVGNRWLKTFGLFIVFGVIIMIATYIVDLISTLFGAASTAVSSILSAFYIPMIPILLTVYYYSNKARIAPPPVSPTPVSPAPTILAG